MSDPLYRPRGASEIVDGTFRLYREHLVPLLTLSALVYLPFIAAMIPLLRAMEQIATNPQSFMGMVLPIVLVGIFWYPVMWGAMTVSVSERYLGREIDAGDAIKRAFGKFGSLVGSVILKWIIIMFGFFLLIVPGFYFIARLFAVPATVLFEDNGVGRALGRSGQLSIGHKGRILGTMVLIWLILIALAVAISMVLGIIVGLAVLRGSEVSSSSSLMMQLPSMIANIFTMPILVIAEVLLYYDARIRHEGYDIEMMNARLGSADAGAVAR